ncbi:MAG: hypothetical protein ACOYMV_12305, partial [Verrucomicrobiia bacterium]
IAGLLLFVRGELSPGFHGERRLRRFIGSVVQRLSTERRGKEAEEAKSSHAKLQSQGCARVKIQLVVIMKMP